MEIYIEIQLSVLKRKLTFVILLLFMNTLNNEHLQF